MKLKTVIFSTVLACVSWAQAQDAAGPFKDQRSKVSYGVGVNIGKSWKNQDIDLDLDLVMKGVRDVLGDKTPLLSDQEVRETLMAFQSELRSKAQEKRKKLGDKNKTEGEKFLAENKTKPGVVTLPSGLQYKVLKEGNGPIPPDNSTVLVNYRGTFINGTEFDSSYSRNQPAEFNMNGVIKGWTEALQKMKVGSKWQVFIPSDLGYGESGFGDKIGPNSALIFEMELLSFKKPELPPTPPVTSDIIKVPSAEELKKGAKIEIIKPDQLPKQ